MLAAAWVVARCTIITSAQMTARMKLVALVLLQVLLQVPLQLVLQLL
jgi:hypothetical protein